MEAKEKARWARILKVYGITQQQYEELDSGSCPICVRNWSDTVRPCIDHDHKTGHIRGLLCIYCNRYIVGRHRDADRLRRVADYLCLEPKGWVVPAKPKRKRRQKK
jgi:hypothetical protein